MSTVDVALRKMRAICRALPDTFESEHFGEVCFCVGKRMFATCGEKKGMCRIVVMLEPEHAKRLVASDARCQPYARQKNVIVIDVSEEADWDEIRPLVLESYRLRAPDEPTKEDKKGAKPRKRTRRK